jgi:hypothetical protein
MTEEKIKRWYASAHDSLVMLPVPMFNTVEQNNYGHVFEMLRKLRDVAFITTDLLEAVQALLTVINEIRAGIVGQEKEWNDCIALANEAIKKANKRNA